MNKDALKKHHFWILFGLIPLLVLIAVILVTSGVGAAIEAKRSDIKKAQDDLNNKKSPKSTSLLTLMDEQKKALEKKKADLWKENWERQIGIGPDGKQDPEKNLLRWPKSDKLAPFNYTADYLTDKNQFKFGEKILLAGQSQVNMNGEYNEFKRREVYTAAFTDRFLSKDPNYPGRGMVDAVAPTVFDKGWDKTLRYVTIPESGTETGWGGSELRWEPLWLALEDIWVQRAMLAAVRQVNVDVGTFKKVERRDASGNALKDIPLDRRFRSRLWEVDLKIERREADGRFAVTGKVRNLSDKLQIFGEQTAQGGRPLVLRVGLTPDPKGPTFDYKIGGNVIPGRGEMDVLFTDEHLVQVGVNPTEINRVEQVFDAATVPVRRIDRLVLGYRDARHAAKPLVMPPFPAYAAEAEAAANAVSEGTGPPGNLLSGGGDPDGEGRGRMGMGGGAAAAQLEGGGTIKSVIEANKKRYIEVTPQVRRMPVGIVLITDQAYIEDVLLAYANSPFRFQITQVTWQRFRGTLAPSQAAAGPVGVGGKGGFGRGGGDMAGGDDDPDEGPARVGSGISGAKGGGFSLGPPGILAPGPGGVTPPPFTSRGSPAGGGGGGVSEGQLTAGLIELSLYGIVTIYEKYDPVVAGVAPPPAPAETPKVDEPKKDEPKKDEPKKDEKAADEKKDAAEPKKVEAPKPAAEPKKDETPKKP